MSAGLVRPFVITGGRTRATVEVRLEDLLLSIPTEAAAARAAASGPDHRWLFALCREPQSIADAATSMHLAVGVVRILAGDLLAEGLLELHKTQAGTIGVEVLERILAGVRAL